MGSDEAFVPKDEEAEELFFDTIEEFPDSSNSSPGTLTDQEIDQTFSSAYQVWVSGSVSINRRREKFIQSMGLDLDLKPTVEPEHHESKSVNETMISSETVDEDQSSERAISDGEHPSLSSSSTQSSLSRWSSDSRDRSFDLGFDLSIKNMDNGTVFLIDEVARDGSLTRLHELGSNQMVTGAEFHSSFGSSQHVLNMMQKEESSSKHVVKGEKHNWLRRLGIRTHGKDITVHKAESDSVKSNSMREEAVVQRIKIHTRKKHWRELSEVYMCQEFKAHDGAILAMKFSPDGKFLATGGEDGCLRVWRVIECERNKGFDFHGDDLSSVYFTINENHQIVPVSGNGEKKDRHVKLHGSSTCVVIPERVFGIDEEPLQELRGHVGDVLDISWSKNKTLLSASADKTVRLWKIGCDSCLQVFAHKNYVTCVQFNPLNEDYFMTGSIDGIVRIWDISSSRVVNWIETKEIITAICFHPDEMKAMVGTMTGQCQLYDVSDNQLELKYEISLQGKKKSPHKRVTSLEFCPHDSTKLMVASADSIIRILEGSEVKFKYKGLKSHGNHVSASFTREGNHIISCTENSIYLLNSASRVTCSLPSTRDIRSSEQFLSERTSLAVPWNGAPETDLHLLISMQDDSHGTRGHATWPEEKLSPGSASPLTLSKSQFKYLKSACQSGTGTWGQVVVTAGWDGRIKSYQNFGLPVQA
ncbi:hypothetical protein LUZ61_019510 [Rhynchospora tenuis]|uniref:Uncharacterized protein n=1 Tax=Rhynchospora tenuis TaxID=198213 RepID=A0AAD6EN74_9POAL|nr:hypothetical protein LUZ61_019510 [Rhynchospora tenuis]